MTEQEVRNNAIWLADALLPIYKKHVWREANIKSQVNIKSGDDGIEQWVHLTFPPYVEVNLTINKFYAKDENGGHYLDGIKIIVGWGDDYHRLTLNIDYPIVKDSNELIVKHVKTLLDTMELLHKQDRKARKNVK